MNCDTGEWLTRAKGAVMIHQTTKLSRGNKTLTATIEAATTPEALEAVRRCLFEVIDVVPIYNERAKDYERKLYTPQYLIELAEEDPYSVLSCSVDRDVVGFTITKPDNGPI